MAGLWSPDLHAVQRYEGLAYASSGGTLLYRESHWIKDDGRRLVLYRCPGGSAFARKQVSNGSQAPDFELLDARDGYREGVRTRSGRREVFTQASATAPVKLKQIPANVAPVIDAGFDSYVRQQWEALGKPGGRSIAFLVPSRLQVLNLQMKPMGRAGNKQRFKLALDAWYGGLAPSILLTYAADDRRLLEFSGVGNIRDASGKYPEVRIQFPDAERGRASSSDFAAASALPLVGSCQDS
jgi:hypothetical protein